MCWLDESTSWTNFAIWSFLAQLENMLVWPATPLHLNILFICVFHWTLSFFSSMSTKKEKIKSIVAQWAQVCRCSSMFYCFLFPFFWFINCYLVVFHLLFVSLLFNLLQLPSFILFLSFLLLVYLLCFSIWPHVYVSFQITPPKSQQ